MADDEFWANECKTEFIRRAICEANIGIISAIIDKFSYKWRETIVETQSLIEHISHIEDAATIKILTRLTEMLGDFDHDIAMLTSSVAGIIQKDGQKDNDGGV